MDAARHFWLLAGPDGAGKTTYAFKNIAAVNGSLNFVNRDEIARGLSPLKPSLADREAARIALSRAREFIGRGVVFSMETTMAGKTHLKLLEEARRNGVSTTLLYFSVQTPEICLERIARCVSEGGHDVDPDIVRRRFDRSHANLGAYCAAADLWRVYEVSGPKPCLAAEGRRDRLVHTDTDCLAKANQPVRDFVEALA